jgi:hypothetical protein
MVKSVCICTSNRPDRVAAFLRSFLANNTAGWKLYASMEPGCPAIREIMAAVSGIPVVSWVNPRNLGPTLNTFMAYSAAFQDGADAVLYADDDMVLSPDAIDLCNWYLARDIPEEEAGLCLCTNHANDPAQPDAVTAAHTWVGLVGQGYCVTAHQWKTFVRRVFFTHKPHWNGDDYDWAITNSALETGRTILRPLFSRSQHTGVVGVHPGHVFPDRISTQTGTLFHLA